jgi:Prenyltransferase and squalene oxidase repeat
VDRKGVSLTSSRRSRAALLAAAALLALGTAAAPASASSSPPTLLPGAAAAGWLARQMTDGAYFEDAYDGVEYPDQGLTVDAIFAFAATGTANDYAARATTWLEQPDILSGYLGDGTDESYAGATAKLLLAAEVRGVDPTDFGGADLPARLNSLLTASGRYSDRSAYGDYSNAFSQALAVIALARLGGAPSSAVGYLASSQCADGGFPLDFAQPTCTDDVDATAMDAQALLAAGDTAPAHRALAYLASVQLSSGGFAETAGASADANSTGLAGQALLVGGALLPAAHAAVFLLGLQTGCSGAPADQGAIAFDTTGFDEDTATRATAQAVLGLAGVGLDRLSASGAHPGAPHLACGS